jgi:hypothetical protein
MEWLDHGCPCITRTHAISPRSLPYATLRVLELTGCILQPQSDSDRRRRVTFPVLEALRLQRCRTELNALQDMISAAPRLADVRLEAVLFLDEHDVYRLRCPAATVVVMTNCGAHLLNALYNASCSVKLNAPRLRRFHYVQGAGYFTDDTSFSMESPTTLPLDHVHLALPSTLAINLRHSLLSAVRNTRLLRLTVFSLSDLDDGYMPMSFSRLERLEIQELSGWCALDHAAAVVGVVDLLSSCPCLRELRLKFVWRKYVRENNPDDPADMMAAVADFSPCRSMDDEEAEAADCCNDLEDDLLGRLSRRCRLDCLRRVVVEFDAEELTCFQVRLLKFLAREAGTLLEEVVVDGGKGYDSSHIDRKMARWRRKRRPRPVSPPPPPAFSEFPPLEAPPCSDGEVDDGDDTKAPEVPVCSYTAPEVHSYYYRVACDYDSTDDEEDISPRHFMHSVRKNKKRGSTECWSVKPNHKGFIRAGWRRGACGGGRRRHHPSLGGGDAPAGALPSVSLPMAPTPPMLCMFRLLRHAPPPAPWRSLFEQGSTPAPPSRVPLITELLCG